MVADILIALIGFNLAAGAAILLAAALRWPARRLFGARIAYGVWLLVPLAGIASLLPARQANALLDPAPLRPIARYTVEQIDAVLAASPLSQGQLALIAAWGLGALLAVSLLVWRQKASLALLGRMTHVPPDLIRAANPAVGPAVVGVLRPRIILPSDFETRFDPREQAVIMAHERAHLAAWDVRINALVALARALLWFNPLVHLAAHLVRIDQEIACDETVVTHHPGERKAYAQALLKAQVTPAPLPLGCYWPARSPHLKERLLMLTRKSPSRRARLAGAALIALAGAGVGYAAWAAQPAQDVMIQSVQTVAQAAAPVIQLAQADAPAPGTPRTVKRVVINKDGVTQTFEGDAIPADIQAEIDAHRAAGDGGERHVIIRKRLGDGGEVLNEDIIKQIGPLPEGAHVVRIECRRTPDDAEPVCTSSNGDAVDATRIIEELKGKVDDANEQVRVFRLQR